MIQQANMNITDEQHKEWYIASLLPHLRLPLSQRKIAMQEEVVEIMMRFEVSPIQDMNIEVQQIHSDLVSLHLELQSLKKGKEA